MSKSHHDHVQLAVHHGSQASGDALQKSPSMNAQTSKSTSQSRKKWFDHQGYPILEQYLWDIGDDEDIERLIDKAIRLILIHPIFVQKIWRSGDAIQKLYRDKTFGEIAEFVKKHMFRISKDLLLAHAQKKKVTLGFNLKDLGDPLLRGLRMASITNGDEENKGRGRSRSRGKNKNKKGADGPPGLPKQKSHEEMYAQEYQAQNEKYKFWSYAEYKELKEKFGIPLEDTAYAHDREIYLWSFLLAIACTVKYLEIEISTTALYDLEDRDQSGENTGATSLHWQGFVMPPTNASAAINVADDPDERDGRNGQVNKKRTFGSGFGAHFEPLEIKRKPQNFNDQGVRYCQNCNAELLDVQWSSGNKTYCDECIKFRLYRECVRKFVLEYENDEIRDDLWPWYENYKYVKQVDDYKKTLETYAEQVLHIEPFESDNSAEDRMRVLRSGSSIQDDISEEDDQNVVRYSRKKTTSSSYQNIRYLRKFAAMFMLSEREIWKDLVALKKRLKTMRESYKAKVREKEQKKIAKRKQSEQASLLDVASGRDRSMSKAQMLQSQILLDDDPDMDDSADEDEHDKSNVDTDIFYVMTKEDRANLKLLLTGGDEKIPDLLYATYPGIRLIDKVRRGEHKTLSTEETVYLEKKGIPINTFKYTPPKVANISGMTGMAGMTGNDLESKEKETIMDAGINALSGGNRHKTSSDGIRYALDSGDVTDTNEATVEEKVDDDDDAFPGDVDLGTTLDAVDDLGKNALGEKQKSYSVPAKGEGHQRFLESWIRLPLWWDINHDIILLELALMHKLNVHDYAQELEDNPYYEDQLERISNGRAFEVWCQQKVNVVHRLRFLTYVVDNEAMPDSTVFLNNVMRYSHLNSFLTHVEIERRGDDPLAASTFVRQQLQDNDLDDGTGIYDADERPVRDIEGEFRDVVQLLEPGTLGRRIWEYVIEHLAQKQRQSLWRALTILAEELPTNVILPLLELYRDAIRRGKASYVNAVCRAVIKGSIYPMATALHLARYMDENAAKDLARFNTWKSLAATYEDIAISLVNEVENDFLLALLVEIPSEIGQMSVLEIAVTYNRKRFLNDARITALISHMWSESEFLNPKKKIRSSYLAFDKLIVLLWRSPVRFYFCPLGLYCTTSSLYIFYVLTMSWVTYHFFYPFDDITRSEILLWIMNAGYILYEVAEMIHKGSKYFGLESILNIFDVFISLNWIVMFTIRFFPQTWVDATEHCEKDDSGCIPLYYKIPVCVSDQADVTCESEGERCIEIDGCYQPDKEGERWSHDASLIILYMGLWSMQIIVVWIRVIGLFQRTERMGPFLRMLILIGGDIVGFILLSGIVLSGFVFALYYTIAGDFDYDFECPEWGSDDYNPECQEVSTPLNSINGCVKFLFQTFLGQQDWEIISEDEYYGISRSRAALAEVLVYMFIFLGTLLLLNLLIAVMATTFNTHREAAKQELSFSRVETTYDLAHRGRLMPPPLNLFAFLVWFFLEFMFFFVLIITCGQVELNIEFLNPYYIKALQRTKEKALIDFDDVPEQNRQFTTARPHTESPKQGSAVINVDPTSDDDAPHVASKLNEGAQTSGGNENKYFHKKTNSSQAKNEVVGDASISHDNHVAANVNNTSNGSNSAGAGAEEGKQDKDKTDEQPKVGSKAASRSVSLVPSKLREVASSVMSPVTGIKDIGQTLGNLFDKIEEQGSDTEKKYCRHCYTKMNTHKGGNIEDYYARFENGGAALDWEDRSRIKRLFRYCSLCPQCFRPFAVIQPKDEGSEPDVDRYTKHTVLQEIASCYVFLVFVWIPLMIAFLPPALVQMFFKRISKLDDTSHTTKTQAGASFGDYHRGAYHQRIKNVIEGVKNEYDFDEDNFGETAEQADAQIVKMITELSSKVDSIQLAQTQMKIAKGNVNIPYVGGSGVPVGVMQSKAMVNGDIMKQLKHRRKKSKTKNKANYSHLQEDSIGPDADYNDDEVNSRKRSSQATKSEEQFAMAGLKGLENLKKSSKGNVLKVKFEGDQTQGP